jgi:hypothetical protein
MSKSVLAAPKGAASIALWPHEKGALSSFVAAFKEWWCYE